MRRLWAPSVVTVAVCSAAPPDIFVERPTSLERVYPSAEDFHAVGGRRLRAEGGKPSRKRYELESSGIVYEYAANCTAPQVLNVDEDTSVVGVACEAAAAVAAAGTTLPEAAEAVLSLRWSSAEAGMHLDVGAVLGGGPGWRCLAAGGGSEPSEFLFEVVSVLHQAVSEAPTTVLAVRRSTIFTVYQDLFIDYSWTPKVQTPSRKLNDDEEVLFDDTIEAWNFNYNSNTQRRQDEFTLVEPALKCTDCWARVAARFQLLIETSGMVPKKAAFIVWPDLSANVELSMVDGLSPEDMELMRDKRKNKNTTFRKIPDMSTDIVEVDPFQAVKVPLFGLINKATLNLMGRVRTEFMSQLLDADFLDELWEGALFAAYFSTNGTFVEVGWDIERGFYLDADFKYSLDTTDLTSMIGQNEAFTRMATTLRPCANLALTLGDSGDHELTGFQVCTDLQTAFNLNPPPDKLAPVVAEMRKDGWDPDSKLCLRFISFATDADLDKVGRDEPYAQACVFGRCVKSPHTFRFSNRVVTWDDQDHCFDVAEAWLHETPVWLRVMEKDVFFDDMFTDLFEYIIPEDCLEARGCDEELVLDETEGTYARLKLKVSVQSLRRLSDSTSTTPDCQSSSTSFQAGVSGGFNGFRFPNFFSKGQGHQVVDPVRSPALRPQDPEVRCVGQSAFISAALQASTTHWLATGVACWAACASAVRMHPLW